MTVSIVTSPRAVSTAPVITMVAPASEPSAAGTTISACVTRISSWAADMVRADSPAHLAKNHPSAPSAFSDSAIETPLNAMLSLRCSSKMSRCWCGAVRRLTARIATRLTAASSAATAAKAGWKANRIDECTTMVSRAAMTAATRSDSSRASPAPKDVLVTRPPVCRRWKWSPGSLSSRHTYRPDRSAAIASCTAPSSRCCAHIPAR